jgi:hypothetical protein
MNKLMYFTGYITSCTNKLGEHANCFTNNSTGLVPGKRYVVEQYYHYVSRSGNGGSSYYTMESTFRVYHPRTNKLLSDNEWWSVFKSKLPKNCKHKELVYATDKCTIHQCTDCFKKFKMKTILREVK